MATTITEECISCGACEGECPNDAISLGEDVFVIDPDLCSECVGHHDTQMCAEACPVDVCVDDPERRESEEILFERARKIAADKGESLELNDSTSHFRAA
ncbi:MAG: YfhL family 4Fe-4S dicluster ferredoxin [Deltaproteobacteria bacterium]|nr:YfhL family 4Fe-4S dicluster ferredoxin [Deltaproteobacteria bacterium]MBW2420181.1 YfhL family 4Fe-4S dicluster ferredoxin [Deltaproteobacteria bacterium]